MDGIVPITTPDVGDSRTNSKSNASDSNPETPRNLNFLSQSYGGNEGSFSNELKLQSSSGGAILLTMNKELIDNL